MACPEFDADNAPGLRLGRPCPGCHAPRCNPALGYCTMWCRTEDRRRQQKLGHVALHLLAVLRAFGPQGCTLPRAASEVGLTGYCFQRAVDTLIRRGLAHHPRRGQLAAGRPRSARRGAA